MRKEKKQQSKGKKESSYQRMKRELIAEKRISSYRYWQIYHARVKAGVMGTGVGDDDTLVGNEEVLTIPQKDSAESCHALRTIIRDLRLFPPAGMTRYPSSTKNRRRPWKGL